MHLLIARQLAIGEGDNLFGCSGVAWAQHHKALGSLTGLLVGHTDYRRVHDRGMLHQQSLDLGGGDTRAPVVYHLFFSVHSIEETLFISMGAMSAMLPGH